MLNGRIRSICWKNGLHDGLYFLIKYLVLSSLKCFTSSQPFVSSADFILWFTVTISPVINSFDATISFLRKLNVQVFFLLGFGYSVSVVCGAARSVKISDSLVGQSISLYGVGVLLHLPKQFGYYFEYPAVCYCFLFL